MPQLQCSACQKVFQVKDEWIGKRVKCSCGNQLVVPAGAQRENSDSTTARSNRTETTRASSIVQSNPGSNLDLMDFNAPAAPINPYAPVLSSTTLGQPVAGDEAIRREHLSHESSIKSIGVLYLLGSIVGFLLTILYVVIGVGALVSPNQNSNVVTPNGAFLIVLGIVVGGISTFQFILARGLSRLTPWCRIGGIVFSCFGLIGIPIGTLISAYFLYLLGSQKGAYIFSPEYARVIAATPQIKYRTSIVIWILLGFLLFIIGLGVVAFLISVVVG